MVKKLYRYPLFFLLLPVFFVFHGFVENFYFIRFADCWSLIGIYIASALFFYGAGWLLLKDKVKAALFASYIMGFYLFFAPLHDFLRMHSIFLHKYSILLPAFIIFGILLIIYLKKHGPYRRAALFLNTLFLLFCLADGVTLSWKVIHKMDRAAGRTMMTDPVISCDNCPKPDIYLILFDGYTGSSTLKDEFRYDNGSFDRFLQTEGFHIQEHSRSNYSITPFSMASMLNIGYPKNMDSTHQIVADDYLDMTEAIRNSRVVNFLYQQGYTIVNYSHFDLPGQPASRDQTFFPLRTRLITHRTLLGYIERDLSGWITDRLSNHLTIVGDLIAASERTDQRSLSETKGESSRAFSHPRFIYTHVFMPHYPFLYDSLMHRRSLSEIIKRQNETDPSSYFQYLPYTNLCAKDLISTIKKNTGGKAIILFMSDHGFRYDKINPKYYFYNQNAVYYPDGDYSMMYDSISNVNQFRVLFNKLFGQHFPLLKDSSFF